MNKQKRNQIIGGSLVGIALLSASIYGLSQKPDSFVADWFNLNNGSNKTDSADSQPIDSSKTSESADSKAFNSKEALEANASSRFEANKDESWTLSTIFREPENSDYVYDVNAERAARNETGVSSVDGYKSLIEIYSTVKANTQYRNATDEIYEKSLNRLSEAFDALQSEYLSPAAKASSVYHSDRLDQIKIQYFASDMKAMQQFDEAISISDGLTLDKSTFKLRYTSEENVYAFEVMYNSSKTGQQFTYMSGYYNSQLDYFQVTATQYMMDGAVAKDRLLQDFSSGYQ